MPDINYTVWRIDRVAYECPEAKVTEILLKLQNRVHELHDALAEANDYLVLLQELLPYFEAQAHKDYFIYTFCEKHKDIIREFKLEYERTKKAATGDGNKAGES